MGFFNFGSGVIGDPAIINAFDFLDCLKQKKKLEIKEMAPIEKNCIVTGNRYLPNCFNSNIVFNTSTSFFRMSR